MHSAMRTCRVYCQAARRVVKFITRRRLNATAYTHHEPHQHPQFICSHMDAGYYNFGHRLSCNANVTKTTSGFNSDHTIQQYAHGLLLESQFLPSSTVAGLYEQ